MKDFARSMKEAITENLIHLLFITESETIREAYLSFLHDCLAE